MQQLKTFFRTLILSCISPPYYNDIVHAPSWFSWKYFLTFQFLSTLIAAITFGIALTQINLTKMESSLLSLYPQGLELTLDRGKLSANKPLPYFIPYPNGLDRSQQSPHNFIVLDTDAHLPTIDDVRAQDAVAVFTETKGYLNTKQSELRVISYAASIDATEKISISDAQYNQFINRIFAHPFISNKLYAPAIASVSSIFIYLFLCLSTLITILFYTIPMWIIAKILLAQQRPGFGTLFRVGMHSMTPIILISTVLRFAGQQDLPTIFGFLLYIIWTYVGLRQAEPTQVVLKKKN